MNIIDAHLHFSDHEGFRHTAEAAGHENTPEHVAETFRANRIVMGIAMGAGSGGADPGVVEPMLPTMTGTDGRLPAFISYCCGLTSEALNAGNRARSLEAFDRAMGDPRCVGIKLYCGYNRVYVNDPRHHPFFELAQAHDLPVVIHTGDTAMPSGVLKYSHPLTVDEAAVDYPSTRFVMAHYGNPWIVDATAVAAKNPNVFIDLSGLAAGNFTAEWFLNRYHGYLEHIRTWMAYLGDYDKFLYGSDWPLVHMSSYIAVIRSLIPEEEQEKVFYANALRVFPRLAELLA